MCAWDRAGRAAKAGQVELLLLPVDEKERNSSVVGEQPGAFQRAVDMEHNAADSLTSIKGLGRKWSWESHHDEFIGSAGA